MRFLFLFVLVAISACHAKAQGINDAPFFKAKYQKDQVYDVQRSPAYPIAGKEWRLFGLKAALGNTGAKIDWGTGRYLMLVAEVDNAKSANSLMDDVTNNGTKQKISLNLYESDGKLVKVLSKWGKIIGRGDKGFMYEIEGHIGTFFSVALVNSTTDIKYVPSLAAITKLSELVNGSDLTKGLENAKGKVSDLGKVSGESKGAEPTKGNSEASFFKVKYTKNQVWEVEKPEEKAVAGISLTYTIKGPAKQISGYDESKIIDWGKNGDRYMMFWVDKRSGRHEIEDDIKNDNQATLIAAKLFERNGTEVGSLGGGVQALGNNGFVYDVSNSEVQIRLFFSKMPLKQTEVITNRISIPSVSKLSQLEKGK